MGEGMRAVAVAIVLSACLCAWADNSCETDGSVQLPGTYWSYVHSYPTNFTTRCFDTCIPVKGNWTGVCPKKLFIKVTGLKETGCEQRKYTKIVGSSYRLSACAPGTDLGFFYREYKPADE